MSEKEKLEQSFDKWRLTICSREEMEEFLMARSWCNDLLGPLVIDTRIETKPEDIQNGSSEVILGCAGDEIQENVTDAPVIQVYQAVEESRDSPPMPPISISQEPTSIPTHTTQSSATESENPSQPYQPVPSVVSPGRVLSETKKLKKENLNPGETGSVMNYKGQPFVRIG
ncbi:MAG: hypothetical protein GY696_08020, partial [Gammaproteobacteria bacterium]|nr:hypothetical protein [Gammaproteobacteria bacterium]